MRAPALLPLAALLFGACATTPTPGTHTPGVASEADVTIYVDNQGWNEVRVELHTAGRTRKFLGAVQAFGSACFLAPAEIYGESRLVARTVLGGRRYIVSPPFAIEHRPGWVWRIVDGPSQGAGLNHGAQCRGAR